jgi:uncharacterized protein YjbJ (UPF0337 family)
MMGSRFRTGPPTAPNPAGFTAAPAWNRSCCWVSGDPVSPRLRAAGSTLGSASALTGEHVMLHKDEVTGKAEQVKGKAKQKIGEWTDDPAMVDEGIADEAEGEVTETVGTAKRKVAETAETVAKKVRNA